MPPAARRPTPAAHPAAPDAAAEQDPPWRAKVRMYRQGLGDCFLVTLNAQPKPYRILIDCGVILGTPTPADILGKVAADIQSGGEIDLLVATHEHWDHLSGFIQAQSIFDQIKVKAVWMGWTENPDDPVAKSLVATRQTAVAALALGEAHLRLAGTDNALAAADETRSMLDFFGASAGSTAAALDYVRQKGTPPVYRKPGDLPVQPVEGVRIFTLGPPTDLALLKKSMPSKGQSYGVDTVDRFVDAFGPTLNDEDGSPFDPNRVIPMAVARHQPFFREHYFDTADGRRRIDEAWLEPVSDLALKLDSDTNNTSLVLAIELEPGGDVLLFAGDAQIGNWESWAKLEWPAASGAVTGPDLLGRTILYKVGHHGSHNATLKPGGLELMDKLKYAMIPVDHAMALKKRWGRMPLDEIVAELDRRTAGRVLRIDQPAPATFGPELEEKPLYFELTV